MKTILIALTLVFTQHIILNGFNENEFTLRNDECDNKNITIDTVSTENQLASHFIGDKRSGIIQLHPVTLDELGGWENFVSSLSEETFTYELTGIHPSNLLNGNYYKYAQYYNGIHVVNGGFTILVDNNDSTGAISAPTPGPGPGLDKCSRLMHLSPHIFEGINIGTNPSFNPNSLSFNPQDSTAILSIDDYELKIVNNISGDCNYNLLWRVNYTTQNNEEFISWVDAHTGDFYYTTSMILGKNAPTADHGIQFLNDTEEGNNTILRNHWLSVYDKTGDDIRWLFSNGAIPVSPNDRDWTIDDADPEIFQLFWMTDDVLQVLADNLNIIFNDVHAGFDGTENGAWFRPLIGTSPQTRTELLFGGNLLNEGLSTVEYDYIGHELGHGIIFPFFGSDLAEGASLHEGLADMYGTYVQSVLDELNWVFGNSVPAVIRDLENTNNNCFTDIADFNIQQRHARGEALGHWLYLSVTGDQPNNIVPLDIEDVMKIITEALPNLSGNPDYPDLMEAVVDIAALYYGICSDEFRAILRAWEEICVPTNHWLVNPNATCTRLVGPDNVCEENNGFNICLDPTSSLGINFAHGTWTIQGRNSTSFQSTGGMQGNQQQGGTCLQIIDIPLMPYYPQTITIRYNHSAVGAMLSKRITIRDCAGIHPTCEEYYYSNLLIENNKDPDDLSISQLEDFRAELTVIKSDLSLRVFDLLGRELNISETEIRDGIYSFGNNLIILTYWDEHGRLITTEKVFLK